MANKKITDLPSASLPLNDTDLMEVVQGGVNKKAPKSEVTSVSQAQLTAGLATKQNTLVSGTNIKTINSSSLLGSGNLNVGGTAFGETTGTNTYGVNFSPALTSYEDTRPYHIRVGNASTGAVTLNFNSLGPRKLYKSNGIQAGSGDLLAGVNYLVAYNSSLDGGVGGLSIVNIIEQSLDARVPKVLTANTDITGDFNLQLGTAASHLNSLSVYTETQLFFHAQDDLVINVHDGVTSDAVGISINPNSMVIAAGAANSTTVTINDENSSTAFSVVANDGSIVITASPGYNIMLTADNIILTGNLSNFVYDEVPTGAINGVNTAYSIANLPVKGFQLFWNGMKLKEGVGFTRTGVNITMAIAPATNDTLECNYIK